MTQNERLIFLIKYLLAEDTPYKNAEIPESSEEQFRLFRSLVNVRPSRPIGDDFLKVQDEFLRAETAAKGITDISELQPAEENIYLWQGDITTLRCGAIVNAANSGMTGCHLPCHICIDNTIHTFAGVQLRLECAGIMQKQGFPEPTGQAKVTQAYNLPCEKIIHTVGPIVEGKLTKEHCRLLESSYRSCLEAAEKSGLGSIALCCISTGVFGFPNEEAAEIALRTVREFLKIHNIKVVFNVFLDKDLEIYIRLLAEKQYL